MIIMWWCEFLEKNKYKTPGNFLSFASVKGFRLLYLSFLFSMPSVGHTKQKKIIHLSCLHSIDKHFRSNQSGTICKQFASLNGSFTFNKLSTTYRSISVFNYVCFSKILKTAKLTFLKRNHRLGYLQSEIKYFNKN